MKQETYAAKLADLFGIAPPEPEHVDTKPVDDEDYIGRVRAGEATLLFFKAPELFTVRTCTECEEGFAVSRTNVGFCSNNCRRRAFSKVGIEYDPTIDTDYIRRAYGGNEPLVVPPSVIKLIRDNLPE